MSVRTGMNGEVEEGNGRGFRPRLSYCYSAWRTGPLAGL